MKTVFLFLLTLIQLCYSSVSPAQESPSKKADVLHPVVIMKTNMGTIEIMLDAEKAPVTVKNFLAYVNKAFYDSTIFHRVIPNFMVQGGGYMIDMTAKSTRPPIKNEAANGLSNKRGMIAMARSLEVDSATSQFFINHKDNDYLDHKDNTPDRFGYAVFGMVTMGMDVIDRIAAVKTQRDVPLKPVVIESVRVKE